jgi:hypothetical protein
MKRLAALILMAALIGLATTAGRANATLKECARMDNHVYEACVAYVVNDAHWSLQPYYKYAHTDVQGDSVLAELKRRLINGLSNRLYLKYKGAAQAMIIARAKNWPSGTNTVVGPDITITDAQSSLACNRAVLKTLENWNVVSQNDNRSLFQVSGVSYTIVLHREPDQRFVFEGHVLHAWVVYDILPGNANVSLC